MYIVHIFVHHRSKLRLQLCTCLPNQASRLQQTYPSLPLCKTDQHNDIGHGRPDAAATSGCARRGPPPPRVAALPRRIPYSRCVCKTWRDVVDAYRLLRVDLLPISLAGIFTHIQGIALPKYFSPVSSAHIAPFDYLHAHGLKSVEIMQHCNGLLLLGRNDATVLNPATRQWAHLPSPPPMCTPGLEGANEFISSCTMYHRCITVCTLCLTLQYRRTTRSF
jgi:hypothetical protein